MLVYEKKDKTEKTWNDLKRRRNELDSGWMVFKQ